MLEIAGGILIAVAILLALPYILVGAYFVFIVGIVLATLIGGWLLITGDLGSGWAPLISIAAMVIWLGVSEHFGDDDKSPEANSDNYPS